MPRQAPMDYKKRFRADNGPGMQARRPTRHAQEDEDEDGEA